MKKIVLVVSILLSHSGYVLADEISYGQASNSGAVSAVGAASNIDIYQVPGTLETDTGSGVLNINTLASDQVNLVQGNVVDNNLTINQASVNQVANIVINAQLPDDPLTGLGQADTGQIGDITLAVAGSVGSSLDATTADGGTLNTVSLIQNNANCVINIGVDGSNNSIEVTQSSDNAVSSLATHGNGLSYIINQ